MSSFNQTILAYHAEDMYSLIKGIGPVFKRLCERYEPDNSDCEWVAEVHELLTQIKSQIDSSYYGFWHYEVTPCCSFEHEDKIHVERCDDESAEFYGVYGIGKNGLAVHISDHKTNECAQMAVAVQKAYWLGVNANLFDGDWVFEYNQAAMNLISGLWADEDSLVVKLAFELGVLEAKHNMKTEVRHGLYV